MAMLSHMMSRRTSALFLVASAVLLALPACNLSDPNQDLPILQPGRPHLADMSGGTQDQGMNQDMPDPLDMSAPQDMPPVTVDMPADMPTSACDVCGAGEVCHMDACCTPQTCDVLGCGTHETCGMVVDCGACDCTPENFQAECPSRPCEQVTGCEPDGQGCLYEPVVCGGLACNCLDPEGCSDDDLFRCAGDDGALTCPASACRPAPVMGRDGTVTYANECVTPQQAACDPDDVCVGSGICLLDTCAPDGCGTCKLGRWECNGDMSGAVCDEIDFSILGLPSIECDDTVSTSTFIYVDPNVGEDDLAQGSRDVPFKTLEAAMAKAETRPPAVIILGRSPGIDGPLQLVNGVSIIGGFGGAPLWERSPDITPTILVTTPSANGDIAGVIAKDITSPTIFRGFSINVSKAGDGGSAYGMIVEDSPRLFLTDLSIEVGGAGVGADGTPGQIGAGGAIGDNAGTPNGAPETVNMMCPIANGGAGGNGRVCVANGVAAEGSDGQDSAAGVAGGNYNPNDNGSMGGSANGRESDGADGSAAPVQDNVSAGRWDPDYDRASASGADGSHGRGGGGGSGSGCAPIGFGGVSEGGGGGAGASGGCGGTAGEAGDHGGGSFGLFIINSTGIVLGRLSILTGPGGDGGNGGQGGDGGEAGARGGLPGGPSGPAAGQGGSGGGASGGGAGGHGAGGPGGPSIGIYCHQTDVMPDPQSQITPGQPGNGGGGPGNNGADGISRALFQCQMP